MKTTTMKKKMAMTTAAGAYFVVGAFVNERVAVAKKANKPYKHRESTKYKVERFIHFCG